METGGGRLRGGVHQVGSGFRMMYGTTDQPLEGRQLDSFGNCSCHQPPNPYLKGLEEMECEGSQNVATRISDF